jgi:PKD repeat protein
VDGGGVTVNSVTFSNITNITLNVTISPCASPGDRTITVTNPDGRSATSASPLLSITAPPCISAQPQSQAISLGSNATFSVTASGTSPLSYQWRFNQSTLPGATDSAYTRAGAQCADAGSYDVVLTNALGNLTSSVAILTVVAAPVITTQPLPSQSVHVGQTANFSVTATNACGDSLAYQWLLQGTNIAGASASAYSRANVQFADAGDYRVVVGTLAGSVTSAVATLTVFGPPVVAFAGGPTNGFVPLTVSFTNLSSGATNYSWDFGDGNTSAATNPINIYANAGVYSVALKAIGPDGTNSFTGTNYVIVSVRPSISTTALDGTNFVFSFDTIANKTYTVQYKDSVEDSVWQPLQSIPGDGTLKTITNSVLSPATRFYRLSVQ